MHTSRSHNPLPLFAPHPPSSPPPPSPRPQIQQLEQLKQRAESAAAKGHQFNAVPTHSADSATLERKLRSCELENRSLSVEKQGLKKRINELQDSIVALENMSGALDEAKEETAGLRARLLVIEAAGDVDPGDDLAAAKECIRDLRRRIKLLEQGIGGETKVLLSDLVPEDRAKLAAALTQVHRKALTAQEAEQNALNEVERLRSELQALKIANSSAPHSQAAVGGRISIDSVEALVQASLERSRLIEETFLSRSSSAVPSVNTSMNASQLNGGRGTALQPQSSPQPQAPPLSPSRPSGLRNELRAPADSEDSLRDSLQRHLRLVQSFGADEQGPASQDADDDGALHSAPKDKAAVAMERAEAADETGSWVGESDEEEGAVSVSHGGARAEAGRRGSQPRASAASHSSGGAHHAVVSAWPREADTTSVGVFEAARQKVQRVNDTRRAQSAEQGQVRTGTAQNGGDAAPPPAEAPAALTSTPKAHAVPNAPPSPGRGRVLSGPQRSPQRGSLSRVLHNSRLKKVRESMDSEGGGRKGRRSSVMSAASRRDSVASIGFPDAGRLSARGSKTGGTLPLEEPESESSEDDIDAGNASDRNDSEEEEEAAVRESRDSFMAHNDPRDYFVDDDDHDVDEDPAQRESVGRLQRHSDASFGSFMSRVCVGEGWGGGGRNGPAP